MMKSRTHEEEQMLLVASRDLSPLRLEEHLWSPTEYARATQASGQRVAIVGAGPAGVCAASVLAQLGYAVTLFESLPVVGGMLAVGIPAFRRPIGLLEQMRELVKQPGIAVRMQTCLGRDLSFSRLQEEFAAILLAVGLQRSAPSGISGETLLQGVIPALDFLRQYHLHQVRVAGEVAVIGGGIATVDVARLALRAGARHVRVFLPGAISDLPASVAECEAAVQEGVVFHPGEMPRSIIGTEDVNVHGVRCQRTCREQVAVGQEPGFSCILGTDQWYWVDVVLVAVGERADLSFLPEGTEQRFWLPAAGKDEEGSGAMRWPAVFLAGDVAGEPRTVRHALSSGYQVAHAMHQYLCQHVPVRPEAAQRVSTLSATR